MVSEAAEALPDASPTQVRRSPAIPSTHPFVYHIARWSLKPVFRAYFRMRGEGVDHVPRRGAFLLAPNHVSMLDWAFISYFLPRLIRFVVHRDYYEQPLISLGLRVNGALPVRTDRPDLGAFRTARAILAAGEPLILFPEGAISRTGRPQRGQPGIIALAAGTGTSIVPVAVRGAFEAFPRWQRVPRPGRVTVVFGAPLPSPKAGDRVTQQELTDRLMAHISALLEGTATPARPW